MLNGYVTPNGSSTDCWFEYGLDPSLAAYDNTARQPVGSGNAPVAVNHPLNGLKAFTTYYYRLCASNNGGTSRSSTASLTTLLPAVLPGASTLAPTSVSETAATLNGSVNPNGLDIDAWFEWGTDPALAGCAATPCQPLGSGYGDRPASAEAIGLTAGTTYYYRIAGGNGNAVSRGEILHFIAYSCVGCHGGENGDQPARFNAPKVTRYWKSSGHGRSSSPAIRCEDCHDVESPPGTHPADGSGVMNSENWPGKPDDTTNANTSHLKPFLLTGATTEQLQANFDSGCVMGPGDGAACHFQLGITGHVHTMNTDNLSRFGRISTVADPKSRSWYIQSDYEYDFYKSWSPWVIQDLTTVAAGPVYYVSCVSCHDPHGTGSTDQAADPYGNAMVRGNFSSDSVMFCNYACHTP